MVIDTMVYEYPTLVSRRKEQGALITGYMCLLSGNQYAWIYYCLNV